MELIIRWLALLLGAGALVQALVRTRSLFGIPPAARGPIFTAGLITVAAAALTLPTEPPFSPGQALAPGILLGGLLTFLGTLCSGRAGTGETALPLAWSGRVGAAAAGVSLLLIGYGDRILDALNGYAFGALGIGLLIGGMGLTPEPETESDGRAVSLARGAGICALTAVALAAATYLATFHRSPTGVREWQVLPALLAGIAALLLAARSAFSGPEGRAWLYDLLLLVVPLGVASGLIAYPLNGSAAFLQVVGLSLAVFALVGWLSRAGASEEARQGPRLDRALLTGLLVLGGAMLAFRELHGYGLALFTLVGFLLAAAIGRERDTTGSVYLNALLLGLLLALYRLHVERNEYTRGFQPDFFYYHVALVLGAMLPALLAGAAAGTMPRETRWSGSVLVRSLLVGGLSVAAPPAVWLLLGDRPQSALLMGLAVGAVLPTPRAQSGEEGRAWLWRLSATTMALSAVQLTHLLTPLALRTRGQRLAILAVVAVVALAAAGIAAWSESRRSLRADRS